MTLTGLDRSRIDSSLDVAVAVDVVVVVVASIVAFYKRCVQSKRFCPLVSLEQIIMPVNARGLIVYFSFG